MTANITIVSPPPKKYCTIKRIGIFGSADVDEQHPVYQQTFAVCQRLAAAGKIIVDGGGPGVMAAATLGARAGGGQTIAVTFKPKDMPEFEGRYAGNDTDLEIVTTNYIERMFGLVEQSDAFIIFQGGTGTLSEWSTVWLLAHLHYGNHKPVILYGSFWPEFMEVVNKTFFIGDKERLVYRIAQNPDEVAAHLRTFEQELSDRCGLPSYAGSEEAGAEHPAA